jgi:8-oxo-dGTP diphosphatase
VKHLLTLTNVDLGLPSPENKDGYKTRDAARAVVTDAKGRVPLLFVSKYKYHKLPGGGVEAGEDMKLALARELVEEIGCVAEVTGEVGEIIEYRDDWQEKQTSHCYTAKQTGEAQEPDFTEKEKAEGFMIKWAESIEDAILLLENDQPTNYEGRFIQKRDLTFLQHADF